MAIPALAAGGAPPPDRRRGRWGRMATHGLVVVLGLVALLFVAGAVVAHSFDPNAYKPRIEAAVLRATGRTLTIDGQLRIGLFNGPRIKATGVSLGNIEGGSRPEMARVAEVKARLSFTALLAGRIEITELELVQPDILLEITAAGAPNWRFAPPPRPQAAPTTSAGSEHPRQGIVVRALLITDGTAVLQDDRDGRRLKLRLDRVTTSAPSAANPIVLAAAATVGATELRLNGSIGPADGATWPVKLDLATLNGAQGTLTGTVDAGLLPGGGAEGRAAPARYALSLAATVQNLASLAPLLPGLEVPPVRDLHLRLAVDGTRGALPALRQLDLSAGHSELGAAAPGLVLEQVSIVDPAPDAPLRARATGSYAGAAFSLAADLGTPAALLSGGAASAPFPISLTVAAAGAHLTAKGSIQDPRALRGLDLALAAQVPDVGAFAPLLHRPVPALQDFSLQARVTDGADGLRHGVTLDGLHVATPGSAASGTLRLAWAPRLSVAGQLAAAGLNAGDLTSAFANPINPPPPAPPAAAAAPAPAAATPPPPQPAQAGPRTVIPDRPIRFDRWTATDLDLALTAQTVTWADEVWRNLSGHLVAGDGRLRLESGAADLPAGHAEASFAVDATPAVPTVALTLRAPGVSVQPLQALLGLPEALSGRLEVDANLHGSGRSPHALAASADGTLGLAMVGGSLDGGDAQAWLAALLRHASLPEGARLSGRTEIECFALRLDLAHGVGGFRALALQTPLLSLSGGGGLNFSDETLALRLRAVASVGIGIAVPFDVTGPFRAPQVRVNISSGATSALEGAAGLMIGRLGGDGAAALGGPGCGSALAAARGGWTGKLPVATAAPMRQAAPAAPGHPSDRAARVFRWLLP